MAKHWKPRKLDTSEYGRSGLERRAVTYYKPLARLRLAQARVLCLVIGWSVIFEVLEFLQSTVFVLYYQC